MAAFVARDSQSADRGGGEGAAGVDGGESSAGGGGGGGGVQTVPTAEVVITRMMVAGRQRERGRVREESAMETDEDISNGGHLFIQVTSVDQAGSYACRGLLNNGSYTDPVSAGELVVLGERCNVHGSVAVVVTRTVASCGMEWYGVGGRWGSIAQPHSDWLSVVRYVHIHWLPAHIVQQAP